MVSAGAQENFRHFCQQHEYAALACGVLVAVAARCVVAFFPHSGEGQPPMYGDFEAQRHWMEITTALPYREWYENTTDNDLLYWGLDYPPLTAYHSWLLGKAGHAVVPECFELHSSRGHEGAACRRFMRASVIVSDLLFYLPGCATAVWGFSSDQELPHVRVAATLALWLWPPLLLIDHGHFQYNGVCFGLCLAAAGCVARGRTLVASVLFTSGLLFKQIALYYAPAFFFGILAHCWQGSCGVVDALRRVLIVGAVVLATAGVIFGPWLSLPAPISAVMQVLHRMFPFARGLYEDKVANVWCSISIVVKLHRLLPQRLLPPFCAATTFAALLPACLCCLRSRNGCPFAAALTVSAYSFFLFAFQVHEKSVLFPCLAACLLPLAMGPARRPRWTAAALGHGLCVCLFSMFPLVVKDKLTPVYAALCITLMLACESSPAPRGLRWAFRASGCAALALHALHALVPPPPRYPDAWTLLITGASCAYFVLCHAAVTAWQICGAFDGDPSVAGVAAKGKAE